MPQNPYYNKARGSKDSKVPQKAENEDNVESVIRTDTITTEKEPYIELSNVFGNFHQGHRQFGENSGKQCVCNSTSAICYGLIRQLDLWEADDLDTILRAGDRLYSIVKSNLPAGEMYVLLTELPEVNQLFDKTFYLTLGTIISGLVIGKMDPGMECEAIMSLDKALLSTLSNFNSCFITFKNSTFAVIHKHETYYVFDSHSRNVSGTLAVDGTSVLVKYALEREVYEHCVRLARSMGVSESDDFEVTGVSVNVNDNVHRDVVLQQHRRNKHDTIDSSGKTQVDCINNTITVEDTMDTDSVLQEPENTVDDTIHIIGTHQIDYMNDTITLAETMDTAILQEQQAAEDYDITIIGTTEVDYTYNPITVEETRELCNMLGIKIEESIYSFDQHNTLSLGKPCTMRTIVADGNCFFRALSSALTGTEKHHRKIRVAVVKHLLTRATEFVPFLRTPYGSVDEYIQKTRIKYVGTWATEMEILSAADLFHIDVIIYNGRWLKYSSSQLKSSKQASYNAIYLHHANECHYEVVCCVEDVLGCCIGFCDNEEDTIRKTDKNRKCEDKVSKPFSKTIFTGLENRKRIQRDKMRQRRNEKKLLDKVDTNWAVGHNKEKHRQYMKTKYVEDVCYKQSVLNYGRGRYSTDEDHQRNRKEYSKRKYNEDEVHQMKVKKRSIDKYAKDEVHQMKVRTRSVDKYANDEVHQMTVRTRSIDKYANDEVHQMKVRTRSIDKYANDEVHQMKVRTRSVEKYAKDEVHQMKVRTRSVEKYAKDEVHQMKVRTRSIDKYANDKVHQMKVRKRSVEKYAKDEVHQMQVRTRSIDKYAKDEVHQTKVKKQSIDKYAKDEVHQTKVKKQSIDKYAKDEIHQTKVKKQSIDKYAKDEVHRIRVKKCSIFKRHQRKTDRTHMEKVILDFKRMASDAPEHICAVCNRRLFRKQVVICQPDSYHCKGTTVKRLAETCISTKYLHTCSTDCPSQCSLENSAYSKLWICYTCHRKLLSGKLPAEAVANNLYVSPIPQELACLNSLEQHLIAKHIPFAKIAALPKGGQRGVHGPVVCVPSNIDKTVSCLPRNESDDQVIRVKLKRKLTYKGHYKYQLVSSSKVKKALEYLRQHNDQYKDIQFNEDWINPLPVDAELDMENDDCKKLDTLPIFPEEENTNNFDISLERTDVENQDTLPDLPENPLPVDAELDMENDDCKKLDTLPIFPEEENTNNFDISLERTDVENQDTLPDLPEGDNTENHDFSMETGDDYEKDDTLPDLPEENNMDNSDFQIDRSHTGDNGMYMDSCLQPVDIGQEILDQQFDKILCVAPAEGNDPVKILMDEENEAKSFPVLFPCGSPTYHDAREARITIARYLHTRLMLADNRFAKSTDYIFYAQYLSEVYQVISSVSIALRKSHVPSLEAKITPKMLVDNDSLREILKTDSGYKFLRPIRGTPAYWQSSQKDLFAMLRQLGIPTWFCSFSAGDTRWPEVLEALLKENNCQQNVNELDWSSKSELLRSNPVTAARMFEHRFQCFLKEVILSPANPVGKVIDYFYRVEFQHRGSPHVHCLFWVEEAPQLDKDSDKDVASFIDRYVTCETPDSDEEELHEIATTVQRHSRFHSKSCRKKGTKCRFNFPRPPSKETYISRPHTTDVQSADPNGVHCLSQFGKEITKEQARDILQKLWKVLDSIDQPIKSIDDLYAEVGINQELFQLAFDKLSQRASVVLQRGTEDVWINQYNKDLLLAWNANMDIQFVLDAYSCIVYIISYISKAEREMGLLLEQARKETLNGNEDAKQAMKKLGGVYLHSRELSAQEAVYRVCNLHLKECSRFVQFIPVGDAIKMSRPLQELKSKSKGGDLDMEDMWMTSHVDRYKNRPNTSEFENMCLATFCSEFRVLSKSEEPSKERKTSNVYQLQNGLGYIRRRTRTKPAVIRYPRFSSEKQPEKYFQSMLQLYLPHRLDSQLKPESFESHGNFYETGAVKLKEYDVEMVRDIVLRNKSSFEKNAEEIERAEDIMKNSDGMDDAWAQICPESELERISCKDSTVEKNQDPESNDDIPDLLEKEKRDHTIEIHQSIMSHEEANLLLRSLNTQQQKVFYNIRQWCLEMKNNRDPKPFYVFITGGAGTGKSHLIKSIFYEANRILAQTLPNPDDISVLLTAPTGVAAFNINAATIHSTFSISIESKLPYQPLGEEKLSTLRAKLENLQILIIDEISMVDHRLLAYIHGRLRQIKQCKDYTPFAKISVIAVGDFYQLPPVKGKSLYSEEVGIDLWNDNFKLVELTEVMRQRDGPFADTLNHLRTRKKNEEILPEDTRLLIERETGENCDAIHIFPTNDQVNLHNLDRLKVVCNDIVSFEAADFEKDSKTGKLKRRDTQFIKTFNTNLARRVSLGIGARVLLTKNIDVCDGLVNGAFATVSYIPPVKEGETFPSSVYVVFDNLKVGSKLRKQKQVLPPIPLNSTPISPVEDRINNLGGLRRQFPLKLSFACTVHKVQGITLEKAVVSLDRVFAPGQAYVALSRVTSVEGLTIQDYKDSAIYCNEKVSGALSSMALFLPQSEYVLKPRSKADGCKVILHNIQSLHSHIEDIRIDQRFITSDIICLTETWLTTGNDAEQVLEGFTFHHKSRSQSYDKDALNLRNQQHGGVGVFCKKGLPVRALEPGIRNLECLVVHCLDPICVLAVIYRPPSYKLPAFRQILENFIQYLNALEERCIVMGDFNEDALNNSTISKLMEQHGFQQCVKQSTTESGTLIDHVYCRDVCPEAVQVTPTYFSYHEAITLML